MKKVYAHHNESTTIIKASSYDEFLNIVTKKWNPFDQVTVKVKIGEEWDEGGVDVSVKNFDSLGGGADVSVKVSAMSQESLKKGADVSKKGADVSADTSADTSKKPVHIESVNSFRVAEKNYATALSGYKQKKYKVTLDILEQMLKLSPEIIGKVTYGQCLELKGDIFMTNAEYDKALDCYDDQNCFARLKLARCLADLGEYHRAGIIAEEEIKREKGRAAEKAKMSGKPITKNKALDDMVVLLAECYSGLGKKRDAAGLLEIVIKGDEGNRLALYNYARVATDLGKDEDALSILLRCIVLDQSDRKVRLATANALAKSDGIRLLRKHLPLSLSTGPAYAFLSNVVRDNGYVAESRELLKTCVEIDPNNGSYVLAYIHGVELMGDHQEAIDLCFDFVKKCHLPNLEECSKSITRLFNGKPPVLCTEEGKVKYSTEEVDLFAIYCVLCKILYMKGNIELLVPCVNIVESWRVRSEVGLHTTIIRNENAYFMCTRDLVKCKPSPLPAEMREGMRKVYVIGDSHSFSPSWKAIKTAANTTSLLVPKLVTGLKHYHLRPSSNFYPKKNFLHVMKSIPEGSECIVIFGEIDCREGLLVAVEKGRYADLEEGMRTTVGYFIKIMEKWAKDKNLKLFIQPVAPVLNETRTIVKKYNKIFEQAVRKSQLMEWIDVFPKFLTDDGANFREDLNLDGTHMHPKYLEFVEEWFLTGRKLS